MRVAARTRRSTMPCARRRHSPRRRAWHGCASRAGARPRTTSVVVVVVGRLSVVVVVLTGFGTLVVDTVVVVVDVVVVGRSDVVVVVGRGRVVVVVCCGFEQATTQASYLARAAPRHAGSRLVHAPPSETH